MKRPSFYLLILVLLANTFILKEVTQLALQSRIVQISSEELEVQYPKLRQWKYEVTFYETLLALTVLLLALKLALDMYQERNFSHLSKNEVKPTPPLFSAQELVWMHRTILNPNHWRGESAPIKNIHDEKIPMTASKKTSSFPENRLDQ